MNNVFVQVVANITDNKETISIPDPLRSSSTDPLAYKEGQGQVIALRIRKCNLAAM